MYNKSTKSLNPKYKKTRKFKAGLEKVAVYGQESIFNK